MSWNIAPECVSTVFLCIIWVYSRKGNLVPNLKNRLFQASFLTTFIATTTNILSTILLYFLTEEILFVTRAVTFVYFVATPLMGMVYFFYTAATIYEGTRPRKRYFLISGIPGGIYLLVALSNPFTKLLFDITAEKGYAQGSWVIATYAIFYLYCLMGVVIVAAGWRRVSREIRQILCSFPIIAALVICVQQIFPSVILSGAAATSALLIIYLYLQNKQMSLDYLTHLPNRHEFMKMLALFFKKKAAFCIVVLSLREFKDINDTHGQHSGDALLSALSNFLKRELGLREGDLFRYSGDEFAILLQNASEVELKTLVSRILRRMEQPWDAPSCTCLLQAAIGIVHYPQTAEDMESLMNGLEFAVLRSKLEGDPHVCYCTPELLEKSKRRHLIAEELERNLVQRGFEIYYQPIYSVEKGEFLRAEALLRMHSEKLVRVFPDEFIPIAEESGLIIEITYLVLEKVCLFLRQLRDEGFTMESVNVNFSALQFDQRDLLPRMLEIIERHGLPFSAIKVELTESTLAKNAETITACLREMDEIGIRVGLDDFGTGYSNLISVLDLPFDTVKLDKSLVWSAVKNERCSIALQNFSHAFLELHMEVLAEGVETEEQRALVVAAGCTMIQGYFYAKPMPGADFLEFLRKHKK